VAAQGHDDQGRPVVMLDTRNGFEVDEGAFDGAIDWRLHKFSDFPAASAPPGRSGRQDHRQLLHRRHPLREGRALDARAAACRTSAARRRHPQVLRAHRRPAPHWRGRCFVFDEREALTPGPESLNAMSSVLIRVVGVLLMLTALALSLSRAPDRPVESAGRPLGAAAVGLHRGQGPGGAPARRRPARRPVAHRAAARHRGQPAHLGGLGAGAEGQRRVITFDLPGFGLTGPFGGRYTPDDYRGDTYARFVIDLLDVLKLPRVVLGGNSLGGEIAWRVATLAPERVSG
jgi:hypothetical protein